MVTKTVRISLMCAQCIAYERIKSDRPLIQQRKGYCPRWQDRTCPISDAEKDLLRERIQAGQYTVTGQQTADFSLVDFTGAIYA